MAVPDFPRITSRQHEIVKRFRLAARRRIDDVVLLDGDHLLTDAMDAGVAIDVVAASAAQRSTAGRAKAAGATVYEVADAVLDAISPVRTPSGIVALARWTPASLDRAFNVADALVVGLCDVQDPGNAGSAIRSADALGATAVLALDGTAHPAGWKALRGSMGSTFRLPVAVGSLADAIEAAGARKIQVIATVAGDGVPADQADLTRPTLLLLGSEGGGLDPAVVRRANHRVTIPMRPGVNSLNVAATSALLLYEARRQRSA
ncbi:MAG TPA: RNA methyltransferase [Vicinamibacterales bacterium]|nr:RNA methyltransferase [Vicinamibacterales bacterium]